MKNSDQWQRILEINRKGTFYWSANCPEFSLLWLAFIGSVTWPPGYWVYHARTTYLDIQAVDEGRLVLTKGRQRTVITGPALVIIPPGEHKLSADISGSCRKRYLGIKGTVMMNNLDALNFDKVQIIRDFRGDEFDRLFRELHRMTEEKNPENIQSYSTKIYRMLLLLSHWTELCPYPEELSLAIRFIRKDFVNINSLEDICRFCNARKSTLEWQFKRYLDTTPIRYLIRTRMDFAAEQLKRTGDPIKEISERCGFSDQLYFSAVFKKYFNCSPRDYRRNREGEISDRKP